MKKRKLKIKKKQIIIISCVLLVILLVIILITTSNVKVGKIKNGKAEYIDRIVKKECANIIISKTKQEVKLDLKKFNALDDFIKSKAILEYVRELFGTTKGIEKIHIQDIIKMCEKNIGNKFLTPNKNMKVFVKKGVISISRI